MNIKKYEAFVKVVELKSLTKAAEALGYTQSGVSHIINSLEEDMGFELLIRNRSGVKLTPDGERVLPTIQNILNYNEQLNQIISSIHGLSAGTVRIGTFTSVGVQWLPAMIKEFQAKHPLIEFNLKNGDYHDIKEWLSEGSVDIGFIAMPCEVNCKVIPLLDDRLMAVLPKNHKFSSLERFPLSEAENEPFISLLESSAHDTKRAIEAAGIKPNTKFKTKDDYAIISMVENGLGISIMPELLLKGHTENIKVMELDPPSKRTIAIAIPNSSVKSPATRSFAAEIIRYISLKYPETRIPKEAKNEF